MFFVLGGSDALRDVAGSDATSAFKVSHRSKADQIIQTIAKNYQCGIIKGSKLHQEQQKAQ